MLFGWLRNQARNAVLQGVQDAAQELTQEGQTVLFQLALPQPQAAFPTAPGEDQEPARKRKAKAGE